MMFVELFVMFGIGDEVDEGVGLPGDLLDPENYVAFLLQILKKLLSISPDIDFFLLVEKDF